MKARIRIPDEQYPDDVLYVTKTPQGNYAFHNIEGKDKCTCKRVEATILLTPEQARELIAFLYTSGVEDA